MEADEVYSQLNDKIEDLKSRLEDNSSRFDALRSDLSDLKSAVVDMKSSSGGSSSDFKSALDRLQSDLSSLKDTVNSLQQSSGQKAQSSDTQTAGLFDQLKKIEAANAESERKYQEQQGLIGKLSAQAQEAGKMIGDWPKTVGDMVGKAVDDGKKEVLNAWEQSKKDILGIWDNGKKEIMDSISSFTTPIVKQLIADAKEETESRLKSLISDEVKQANDEEEGRSKYLKLTVDEFEERVTKIAKLVDANK